MNALPDFRSPDFLREHIAHTMAFYHPRAIDPNGGFFHYFKDDGTVYDARHRHLVSSTRFVFNYAMAFREFGEPAYLDAARHGLAICATCIAMRQAAVMPGPSGMAVPKTAPIIVTAWPSCCWPMQPAFKAGVIEAAAWMDETWELLEGRFWDAVSGLVPRRSRPRLGVLRLPRPERQHAYVRGHAGGLRGQRRPPLSWSVPCCSPIT